MTKSYSIKAFKKYFNGVVAKWFGRFLAPDITAPSAYRYASKNALTAQVHQPSTPRIRSERP